MILCKNIMKYFLKIVFCKIVRNWESKFLLCFNESFFVLFIVFILLFWIRPIFFFLVNAFISLWLFKVIFDIWLPIPSMNMFSSVNPSSVIYLLLFLIINLIISFLYHRTRYIRSIYIKHYCPVLHSTVYELLHI